MRTALLRFLRLSACSAALCVVGVPAACGSSQKPAEASLHHDENTACPKDQMREYFCDELLPTANAKPAPEPYETCPGSITSHAGVVQPVPSVAVFDVPYTQYIRHRAPPGSACCYSWCSAIKVVAPSAVPADRGCAQNLAMPETFCFNELEGGNSEPASSPYERCPAAIQPPAGASFAVPAAAGFDAQATAKARQSGLPQCCYGWCSKGAPSGIDSR